MKRTCLIFSILILFGACTTKHSSQESSNQTKIDTKVVSSIEQINEQNLTNPYSIQALKIDTTTLSGKRQKILNNFVMDQLIGPEYDTLFDINYDGFKDYVIGYFGQAGTGLKSGIEVFLYLPNRKIYLRSEQLSNVRNPSFYLKQKMITGFYLGNGAGDGYQLEWNGNKWVTTKEFKVDNEQDSSRWEIYYPLTKKKKVLIRDYEMIPPQEILKNKF